MKNMKYILLLFAAIFQLPLFAQETDPDAVLDKVVSAIKAGSPVCMDYSYKVYDDERELLQSDKGVIYIDNSRYALLMQDMKVWCDGATQWSYMREVDEIYVTDASSDEAQNLSPLYVMECYREGYDASLDDKGDEWLVKLQAEDDEADVESVELLISKDANRLVAMLIHLSGQGYLEIVLDGYTSRCGIDKDVFECPLNDFPGIEVIDMR